MNVREQRMKKNCKCQTEHSSNVCRCKNVKYKMDARLVMIFGILLVCGSIGWFIYKLI